ncbi:MAG: hypothetical protein V1787_04115, partial [Candidatus Micrarchaeota archaeon]
MKRTAIRKSAVVTLGNVLSSNVGYLLLLLAAILVTSGMQVAASQAALAADKAGYLPAESAILSGSNFLPASQIGLTLTLPDGTVEELPPLTSDDSGAFSTSLQLSSAEGQYMITATDSTNSAESSFSVAVPTEVPPEPSPTETPIVTDEATASPTEEATVEPTETPVPTDEPSVTPTETPTPLPTETPTPTEEAPSEVIGEAIGGFCGAGEGGENGGECTPTPTPTPTATPTPNCSAGPNVTNIAVFPNPTNGRINITATVYDNCSTIRNAEFFFDYCGMPGTGIQIRPADDNQFNNDKHVEYVRKLNYDHALPDGRHAVYMRGKNSQNYWGMCNFTPFDIDLIPPEDVRNFTVPYWACAGNPPITAEICDSQTPIVAAEYFLDGTWDQLPNGWGYPMSPADGGWGELCEDVNGTINGSALIEGLHCAKLHGQDMATNWGKMTFMTPQCFVVDRTPPRTDKTVGTPKIECGYYGEMQEAESCWFINQSTGITMNASDPVPPDGYNSDSVLTRYRMRYKYDYDSEWDPWSDWAAYGGPIHITEDSIHEIEYYSHDFCSNEEQHHFEIDIVDTRPPVSQKLLGGPAVPCGVGDDCDFYINQSTTITLECEDQQPHPVGGETIYYRTKLDDQPYTEWMQYTQPFTYPEESRHEIQWYCVDALGNTEQVHTQVEKVDSQAPTVEKIVGEPKHECVPFDEDCDWYVNQSTPFTLIATDYGHAENETIETYYKYCWNDGEIEDCTEWMLYTGPFTYAQDSWHTLYYYALDYIGNPSQVYTEYDVVDSQPPEVRKWLEGPRVACEDIGQDDCDYYITQDTIIGFECHDTEPHPVGHEALYYRYRINDGEFTDWILWVQPFSFEEDSRHTVEYYCMDALGNINGTFTEIDVVDSQPPETTKEVGEPKHACQPDEECDWYITQDTEISLTCTDPEPHPVDHTAIYYRYAINDGEFTEWTAYEQPFTYPEDSRHTLEYYCTDLLGNEEQTQTETDIVETVPPVTTKEVGDPKVSCSELEIPDCDWYINQSTTITLTCTDPEPHPADHTTIHYRYAINDGEFTEWTAYEQP